MDCFFEISLFICFACDSMLTIKWNLDGRISTVAFNFLSLDSRLDMSSLIGFGDTFSTAIGALTIRILPRTFYPCSIL